MPGLCAKVNVECGTPISFMRMLECMAEIRVVIVDDDPLVRRALALYLQRDSGIAVVGEATDGVEGVALVMRERPDVVLMDLQMPRMGGVECTAALTSSAPETRVVAVTTFGGYDAIVPMLRAGASGYLLKDAEPEAIIAAIRHVSAGVSALSPDIATRLVDPPHDDIAVPPDSLLAGEELTERESEVIAYLSRGRSNAEIAASMHVSEGTVKAHLGRIMVKWNVRDRVQLLIRAIRAGLVDLR